MEAPPPEGHAPGGDKWMSYLAENLLLDLEDTPAVLPGFLCAPSPDADGGMEGPMDKKAGKRTRWSWDAKEEDDDGPATVVTGRSGDSGKDSEPQLSGPRNKASREKLRRERLNDRFAELAALLEPGKPAKTDKATILADAARVVSGLREEGRELQAANQQLTEELRKLRMQLQMMGSGGVAPDQHCPRVADGDCQFIPSVHPVGHPGAQSHRFNLGQRRVPEGSDHARWTGGGGGGGGGFSGPPAASPPAPGMMRPRAHSEMEYKPPTSTAQTMSPQFSLDFMDTHDDPLDLLGPAPVDGAGGNMVAPAGMRSGGEVGHGQGEAWFGGLEGPPEHIIKASPVVGGS